MRWSWYLWLIRCHSDVWCPIIYLFVMIMWSIFLALGRSSMERTVLLTVGHWLRQNPYSYNCFSFGTSTDYMGLVLLRFAYFGVHVPSRSLVHHQTHQWWARFRHFVCIERCLFRWCDGSFNVDTHASSVYLERHCILWLVGCIFARRHTWTRWSWRATNRKEATVRQGEYRALFHDRAIRNMI